MKVSLKFHVPAMIIVDNPQLLVSHWLVRLFCQYESYADWLICIQPALCWHLAEVWFRCLYSGYVVPTISYARIGTSFEPRNSWVIIYYRIKSYTIVLFSHIRKHKIFTQNLIEVKYNNNSIMRTIYTDVPVLIQPCVCSTTWYGLWYIGKRNLLMVVGSNTRAIMWLRRQLK